MSADYRVLVDDIGMVYEGTGLVPATRAFETWSDCALDPTHRAHLCMVKLLLDGELLRKFDPVAEALQKTTVLRTWYEKAVANKEEAFTYRGRLYRVEEARQILEGE